MATPTMKVEISKNGANIMTCWSVKNKETEIVKKKKKRWENLVWSAIWMLKSCQNNKDKKVNMLKKMNIWISGEINWKVGTNKKKISSTKENKKSNLNNKSLSTAGMTTNWINRWTTRQKKWWIKELWNKSNKNN